MTIAEAGLEMLRELNAPFVVWGDANILHMIAERAGRPHRGPKNETLVLNALGKSPLFKKSYVGFHRTVRQFTPVAAGFTSEPAANYK